MYDEINENVEKVCLIKIIMCLIMKAKKQLNVEKPKSTMFCPNPAFIIELYEITLANIIH